MNTNNLYNFKNTVRHFFNIDEIKCKEGFDKTDINNISWAMPVNFRVRKDKSSYRVLKFPNILNFLCALEVFKNEEFFGDTSEFDSRKRLVPSLATGDFMMGTFDEQLEEDLLNLCIYDNLIRVDIKAYYERIYTHDIDTSGKERFLTNLNTGNTNGLIMGNYISLYFAEKYSKNISEKIQDTLNKLGVDCKFSYFSDDFYFFCNKHDNEKIINLFDKVLESFNLERNEDEVSIWDYLKYNDYNLIEKYWRKIVSDSINCFDNKRDDNILYFTNQLIYRMSNLEDDKSRKIFLNTFFKSTYFRKMKLENFYIQKYNYHQLCYLFKFSPEILIYSLKKFSTDNFFKGESFKEFLKIRYEESLKTLYHEEQLYYYYAIKIQNFNDILLDTKDLVLKSSNQLLISYYLKEKLFKEELEYLKEKLDEKYWFQNYHLILYSDLKSDLEENIKKYLIPQYAKKGKIQNYIEFYKINLENNISIIKSIDEVTKSIERYLQIKELEKIQVFSCNEKEVVKREVEKIKTAKNTLFKEMRDPFNLK